MGVHISGCATSAATASFAASFPVPQEAGFYRRARNWTVSSLGIGTYLGPMDDGTDQSYTTALTESLNFGVNFIDTSLNYRNQRSERAIAAGLAKFAAEGHSREGVVVCTKAGYLVPDAAPPTEPPEILGGMHCIAPAFLADQLERSRRNLALDTIDVFYLHNPETQLGALDEDEFYSRIERAFQFLEQAVAAGKIQFYGVATWDGFRRRAGAPVGLSLVKLDAVARAVSTGRHHFRFVQLPFNFAMPEAFTLIADEKSVLTRAADLDITVVASASLLQAGLARSLPDQIKEKIAGVQTDAQRALQFTRSTPGITTALVGMKQVEHVRENLRLAEVPPLPLEDYLRLYS